MRGIVYVSLFWLELFLDYCVYTEPKTKVQRKIFAYAVLFYPGCFVAFYSD